VGVAAWGDRLHVMAARYLDGGGLTTVGRARREAVRLQAAALLAEHVLVGQSCR
jgi:putative transposase